MEFFCLPSLYRFFWSSKKLYCPHPSKKDCTGQSLKTIAYESCCNSGDHVKCPAKRWRFDFYDSAKTMLFYFHRHTHHPNERQMNKARLHIDGYVEARDRLNRGDSVRVVSSFLAQKYDESFTSQRVRAIKRSLYTLNQLKSDDIIAIRTMFVDERSFIRKLSLVSPSCSSELFIVCILPQAVDSLVEYGVQQIFIDGLHSLSSYSCQIVNLHVKVHGSFFTLGYCIISG